jgi:hypothetical protein
VRASAVVLALLIAGAGPASAWPTLRPVDEGPRNPTFTAFRDSLRAALLRHDADAVLAVVDSNIKTGFGGDDGIAAFERQWHPRSMDSPLWRELGGTLALGGTFDAAGSFVAPYVYSRWPGAIDAFGHVAITGVGVRVRAEPSLDGRIVGRLSHVIVPVASGKLRSEDAEWTRVQYAPGRSGCVASRYARSPVGYRAFFMRGAAGWRMVMFLAGD